MAAVCRRRRKSKKHADETFDAWFILLCEGSLIHEENNRSFVSNGGSASRLMCVWSFVFKRVVLLFSYIEKIETGCGCLWGILLGIG